jgi:hypothetical protein
MFRDLPDALLLELIEAQTFDTGAVLHVYEAAIGPVGPADERRPRLAESSEGAAKSHAARRATGVPRSCVVAVVALQRESVSTLALETWLA